MYKILEKIKASFLKIFDNKTKLIMEKNFEDELLSKYGNCIERKKYNIKILFITDTHNCLTYDVETLNFIKSVKDYDYCILLGDHSANDLVEILKIVPKDKICGVLGNHDSWEKYKEYSINNIDGKVIEVKGIKIAGIGGSFKYKNSEQYALYTHEESIEIANKIKQADILISHDRPFIEDTHDDAHDGLKGITECIYRNHIPLHIHGHLHEDSEEILKNGTKSIGLYKVKVLKI